MKKYSCHDKHYKVILFQAAVITLLFHVAILYSFVYEPPVKKTEQTTGRRIVMFNAASGNNSEQSLAINRWLEYHNPSLIARPDYVNGYGAVSPRPKMRKALKDLSPTVQNSPVIPQPKKFVSLGSGNKIKVDNNSRFVGYQTLAVRPLHSVNLKSSPQNYPLFKLSNGKYIGGILTSEELKYHNLSTNKTTGNTVLQTVVPVAGMMPRIAIKSSCGIAKLDHLAVRKLLLNRQQLIAAHNSKPGKILQLTIIWREVKR